MLLTISTDPQRIQTLRISEALFRAEVRRPKFWSKTYTMQVVRFGLWCVLDYDRLWCDRRWNFMIITPNFGDWNCLKPWSESTRWFIQFIWMSVCRLVHHDRLPVLITYADCNHYSANWFLQINPKNYYSRKLWFTTIGRCFYGRSRLVQDCTAIILDQGNHRNLMSWFSWHTSPIRFLP